jgi:hypothetical protein
MDCAPRTGGRGRIDLDGNMRNVVWGTAKEVVALITIAMVPGEGIEPPTFGLQNRCSTAELTRH